MKVVTRTLLYSCKQATELIEKKQVVSLSLIERARLNGHLSLCDSCSVYNTYSNKMNTILRSHFNQTSGNGENTVTNETLKQRLLKLF